MKQLQLDRAWCCYKGKTKEYVVPGHTSGTTILAEPNNLMTWWEASCFMQTLVGDSYPPHASVALNLDAAGVICVSLMNTWSEERGIEGGGSLWAEMIDSYTERCHAGLNGTSVRIICRGKLPQRYHPNPRVLIQTDGFVTLTCERISARPGWRPDNGGDIKDATEALAYLLCPPAPKYVSY